MSLISKQSRNRSTYSTNHPQYSLTTDNFDHVATISSNNYPSYEKSYYRHPKFHNCPFANQSECESHGNYINDITVKKNSQTIISLPEDQQSEYSPLSSFTSSDKMHISNISSESGHDTLPETCFKLNEALPNFSSEKYDERSRCRVKNSRARSLPMASQRELTPTVLRIGTQALYNNFQCDFYRYEEMKCEKDKIKSQELKLQYDKSVDCDLDLKTSMTNLVNSKSEAFVNVQHETLIHSNTGVTSSSLSELNKLPVVVARKKQNRFPFTICDNHQKPKEIFQYTCGSNTSAINTDEIEKMEANSSVESINDEVDKLYLPDKNKIFGSWMKRITRIFSSQFKKKNITKQNSNIEILFERTESPYNSSEIGLNKRINYSNCGDEKMEFRLKERFRKLDYDDLWIQDIVPVNDSNDTDSRYSLFLVKKARDKVTATNNGKIHSPSASRCAKCQCHSVTSSLATDTKCQQSIKHSTNVGKKIKTDCHVKLSRQCFCFRICNLFPNKSNESITKEPVI